MLHSAIDHVGTDQFASGYCMGSFDATVDAEKRIRLSRPTTASLKDLGINELWQFPAIEFKGIILCPSEYKPIYVHIATDYLLSLGSEKGIDNEIRKYISPGLSVKFDKQGRISFTSACMVRSKMTPGMRMTISGASLWYEIWHHDDLDNQLKKAG